MLGRCISIMARKYSVIRPFQRAVTAMLPHPGNSLYAVPRHSVEAIDPGRNIYIFDGIDGKVVTNINDNTASAGGMEADVMWSGGGVGTAVYMLSGQNNQTGIFLTVATGNVSFQRGGQANQFNGFSAVPDEAFHISMTWDGGNAGSPTVTMQCSTLPAQTFTGGTGITANLLKIGVRGSNSSDFFPGAIANVKFWTTTDDTGSEPSLDIPIDEGEGATEVNNYGTLGNATYPIQGGGAWDHYKP